MRDFKEFKEFIKGKRVAVIGIGVSNRPLIKKLISYGAIVTAFDKKEEIEAKEELENLGVKFVLGNNYLEEIDQYEVIFRTPSLLPTNEYLLRAKQKGAYITSEIRELVKYCKGKIFGVTGSDGKTTTTTLIYEMLKKQGYNVYLGGNIGIPLFEKIEEIKEDDLVVLELSSFQLMDFDISPDVSVITNLSPNHLDYHTDMDEYVDSKKNIFKHQSSEGITVLNRDNDITYSMREEVKSNLRMFSMKENAFSYYKDGSLYVDGRFVCNKDEVKLIGMHNIENLITAFSAVYGYVSIENMRHVAIDFSGVEHRIEFVRELNGVKFYNDSIASSPTRTLAGLNSFDRKVILIAGGYDKNIPFEPLAEGGIDKIKVLVLLGMTKDKIKKAFIDVMNVTGKHVKIIEANSLEDAVFKAYSEAERGDIITLSPACASFDMFKNFEERGNKFKDIVNSVF
ncbi:UDP-N-acetylmuramoylalanine--D-glutamate ligase [Caloramator mitchellensis]|uniref:UDP-N-acetylmuramoylalanine--D-glutamate ligase n=1 Tax=Caloramator mitchellensis TaxID=908809 RepID=A0A0R3JQT5_CALMK|nr:UDP-N-acetylmuramoyl-L-alanine--D-glutamate ligase [Caloramator mitchellensis]KRQ85808.1 UDP-N-acetylmuramoylalanine--D-glutamate ligase [Caloramator mitchellensis]